MASGTKSKRRKRRKVFTRDFDDDDLDDDAVVNAELKAFGFHVDEELEDDGHRWGYDLQIKLNCERFTEHFDQLVERLEGKDFNARYIREGGFKKPVFIEKPDNLDLLMPSAENFTVRDVKKLVGPDRTIDVVDVRTHKGSQMTLREFVHYYQRSDRKKLLNVLSLEFSKTKLAEYVRSPAAVRELDWVELAWPEELRAQQIDTTNALNAMKYPKVQNYCLMSVGNCYTDFHVDFGGTSVWYHILRGEKIFWLIPPTEENCQHFQAWTLSGRQHKTFFGDLVEQCVRVKLKAGNTFMIPSGWFHAVYTPMDSLVFGGNFLHSFAAPMQLSVYEIERNTHVPLKFRYPFFLEMQWYVLERYYSILTGRSFLRRFADSGGDSSSQHPPEDAKDIITTVKVIESMASLLTDAEMEGLHTLVNWLQALPSGRRNVPELIEQPDVLLRNFRELLSTLESMPRRSTNSYFTILSLWKRNNPQEQCPAVPQSFKNEVKDSEERKKLAVMPVASTTQILERPSTSTSSATFMDRYPTGAMPPPTWISKSESTIAMNDTPSTSISVDAKIGIGTNRSSIVAIRTSDWFDIIPEENVPIIGAECVVESIPNSHEAHFA